jgi:hypothetical protein
VTSLRANVPDIPQPTCSLQQNLIHAHIERNTKSQPYVTKAQATPRKKIRRNCSAKKSFIILHNVCMGSSWSSFFTKTALEENPNLYTRSSQRIHSSNRRLQTQLDGKMNGFRIKVYPQFEELRTCRHLTPQACFHIVHQNQVHTC